MYGELGIERGHHRGVQDAVEAGAGDEADVITAADVVEPCCGHRVEERAEPFRVGEELLGRKQTDTHHGAQPSLSGPAGEAKRMHGLGEGELGSSIISASRAKVASRSTRLGWSAHREEGGNSTGVVAVEVAQLVLEVGLLEPHADQDVAGGGRREEQVPCRHARGRPKGHQQAEHQRVANPAVQPSLLKCCRRVRPTSGVQVGPAHTEHVKVVDHERGTEGDEPAKGVENPDGTPGDAVQIPCGRAHRLPLPEQQQQNEARREHIRAALHVRGDPAGHPLLETGARHDRVLKGEEEQQRHVNDDGDPDSLLRSAVDPPG